jgi:Fe-Mn family superoxide dismutase
MEKHILPKLEYGYNALEPFIDAKTMEIHYTKHHQAYVDNLNKALEKYPELQEKKVEELLMSLDSLPEDIKIMVRNNGGGHFNHSFFWQVLTGDKKKQKISSKMKKIIEKEFESFDKFKELLIDMGMKRFGSGWAWLVLNNGRLDILSTPNQDSPLMEGKVPILGIDVWEHAYYLKYQNRRKDYLDAIFNVINWTKVEENYQKAIGK